MGAPMGAPMGANPYAAMGMSGGETRFKYNGTGGGLFGQLFVGYLLTLVTLGVYMPWFIVRMLKYVTSNTQMTTPRGQAQLGYSGEGGALFGEIFVGYIFTILTLGIYFPWFICKLARHVSSHLNAQMSDGTRYNLMFSGEGGSLFGTFIVGQILMMLTLGIYFPWYMCKVRKFFASNTKICANGQPIGTLDFIGEGGSLLGNFILGMILTFVTIGIYGCWFNVRMTKFWAENTRANVNGMTYSGDFTGTGGQLFGIFIVGYLLTLCTLGIYAFWFMTNMIRFSLENHVFRPGNPPPT